MKKICLMLVVVALIAAAACGANAGSITGSVSEITLSLPGTDTNPSLYLAGFDYTSQGNIIAYAGSDVVEVTSGGTVVRTLYQGSPDVYGSFVKVNSGTDKIYFGESSNGKIYEMNSDGTGLRTLLTLAYNYDMAIDSAGRLIVCALSGSTSNIFSVDAQTGDAYQLGGVAGNTGPLAFGQDGTLYYGTADGYAAPGTQSILSWSSTLLGEAMAGQATLSSANAGVVIDGINGVAGMALDASGGIYYTKSSKVWRVSDGVQEELATAGRFYLTTLRFNPFTGLLDVNVGGVYDGEGYPLGVISSINTPEPSSLIALCSLAGVALARRRKTSK